MYGAALGALTSGISAGVSAAVAADNRKFQERMYKNRYTYQVDDLKRAGLNPALAYGQTPPAGPPGDKAQIPDFGKDVGKNLKVKDERQALKAQTGESNARAGRELAQTNLLNMQAKGLQANAAIQEERNKWFQGLPEWGKNAYIILQEIGGGSAGGGASTAAKGISGALDVRKTRK
jgi:hypothetical protein